MKLLPQLLLFFCLLTPAEAQDFAAVLSKGSGPYFEAYLSFQKAFGRPVPPVDLSLPGARPPRGLKAVVAFGSKAAALNYGKDARVIYALAPGFLPPGRHGYTAISTLPKPERALAAFRELQPGLRRLAVLYRGQAWDGYLYGLAAAGKTAGIEVIRTGAPQASVLPETLRSLLGRADAFWLLPEPSLISRDSLAMLASFSCSNKLPFYAPSAGLLSLGATAALAPDFSAAGEAAAAALAKALRGETLPEELYAGTPLLSVNREAATRCNLPLAGAQGGRK